MIFLENISKARSKKFQHSFQPIYYFSRSIGLWPFSIIYHLNGSISARIRPLDGLWFFISICLYLIAFFFACLNVKDAQIVNAEYYLSDLISFISQIPTLLLAPVIIALDMYNRNRLINILDSCTIFDKEVGLLHESIFRYKLTRLCLKKHFSIFDRYRNSGFISTIKKKIDVHGCI